jgi:NADH dehydrogenase/NADH:ubiquinone oxidoreductase subunit G
MRRIQRDAIHINNKNPLIVREMERCIQCGRCVRACSELRGVGILGFNKLGWETYIGTENDLPLADSGCRFCGACVEVCPTSALRDVEGVFRNDIPREAALVPCSAECPAGINIPRYIRYIKDGKYSQSVAVVREKVPFPLSLGYVCNRRCETGCRARSSMRPFPSAS